MKGFQKALQMVKKVLTAKRVIKIKFFTSTKFCTDLENNAYGWQGFAGLLHLFWHNTLVQISEGQCDKQQLSKALKCLNQLILRIIHSS